MDTEKRDSTSPLLLSEECPSRLVLEILANKWALYVLGVLSRNDGTLRFTELKKAIGAVTQKSLTQTLRGLERDGFLTREVFPVIPPRVEYSLTDLGASAGELTSHVARWARDHAASVMESRVAAERVNSSLSGS